MKLNFIFLLLLILTFFSFAQNTQTWYKIKYNNNDEHLQSYVQAGIIESDMTNPEIGWIKQNNYQKYSTYFDLVKLDEEIRIIQSYSSKVNPDSIGQVLETYILPPQVESVRGLGFDGKYFWIADADINNEKIHKLDPNNNFSVLHAFVSPGPGSLLPWGVACDDKTLYIADGLQDAIFKTDTLGNILTTLPSGGPLSTGLGYRTNELWNSDLGDFLSIPERMYKLDSLGNQLAMFSLSNTVNGCAANDSLVFYSRNVNNGNDIRVVDPSSFAHKFSFPSPLDYPNGLAFDGFYLWICGLNQGQGYIMKVDVGSKLPVPEPVDFNTFELIENGMFNNRFESEFDSEGNVHIVYATQFETTSDTKDIMYATNKTGVWELIPITVDGELNEFPVLKIDANDNVHVMWKGFAATENDNEIFYTNNSDSSGKFLTKIQITSKINDGIEGHVRPDFDIDSNGDIHFTFTDTPQAGWAEVYYAKYANDTTSAPINISNNSAIESDPKILIDDANNPHIFCNNYISGLNHATNSTGLWQIEPITDMGSSRPGVVLDSQDNFHFSVTNGDTVKYGNNTSGSFVVEDIVAIHLSNCFYPDLAIDVNDVVHLTYHSFGDSATTWPGNGEIFYSNTELWNADLFPQNISQLANEQEIYPGIAATGDKTVFVGWAKTGVTDGVFSNIRIATTLPDSGGYLSGKINTTENSKDFGFVPALDSVLWSFDVFNSGTNTLNINDIVWDGTSPFIVTSDFSGPQSLNCGDSITVNVTIFITAFSFPDTLFLNGNPN